MAVLDIRYTEKEDLDALLADIKMVINGTVNIRTREPVFDGGTSPYLDLLVTASGGAALGFEHGASDARYLSERGIPGVVWGADGELSMHTAEDRLVISSLTPVYEGMDRFLKQVAESGPGTKD